MRVEVTHATLRPAPWPRRASPEPLARSCRAATHARDTGATNEHQDSHRAEHYLEYLSHCSVVPSIDASSSDAANTSRPLWPRISVARSSYSPATSQLLSRYFLGCDHRDGGRRSHRRLPPWSAASGIRHHPSSLGRYGGVGGGRRCERKTAGNLTRYPKCHGRAVSPGQSPGS